MLLVVIIHRIPAVISGGISAIGCADEGSASYIRIITGWYFMASQQPVL